jgi:hypothetical protein
MSENLDLRILFPADKEALLAFAKRQLAASVEDTMEREMQSWNARWRGEALDHYLTQGWSYGAFVNDELRGFLLGQPLLFYRGLTQTLWVEHVEADSPATTLQLLDAAYKWARDKHLQCVVVEDSPAMKHAVSDWKNAHPAAAGLIEIKSARY